MKPEDAGRRAAEGMARVMGEHDEVYDLGPEDKPESAGPDVDRETLRRRCDEERETMTGSETAECAGAALAEEFEREEDGGS
jgi:hypothetical protein